MNPDIEPAKELLHDQEAREKLLEGMNKLTKAVASTLGAKGQNVALQQEYGTPKVVHDGVTVAEEINLPDKFENMGAQLIKDAAKRTNEMAGDGTTTATILAHSIITQGLEAIKNGANAMIMKRGIEKAVQLLVEELKKIAVPVKESDYIKVATISAQDPVIGEKIAEAVKKVGKDGVITVEEGSGFEIEVEVKEGMEFERGYCSPWFMTNTDTEEAIVEDPYILLVDFKIFETNDLKEFLTTFTATSKKLVIIAENVEGAALKFLTHNKVKNGFEFLPIKCPERGDRRKAFLQDIATLTGGKVISADTGASLARVTIEDLGRAQKVIAKAKSTLIIGGKGSKEEITNRADIIKKQIEKAPTEWEKDFLQDRVAKLTGGVAVINVGAQTESEIGEKKERVIDAVRATQSAIEEGIVPGGEIVLIQASGMLEDIHHYVTNTDEIVGYQIIINALRKPFVTLMFNSGMDEVTDEFMNQLNPNFGVDVMDLQVKDMVKTGIVDPVKVTRCALQNAASVAIIVLTTACLVAKVDKKE